MGNKGWTTSISSKILNNKTIFAARDGAVAVGKAIGVDLTKVLKFKPYGAVKVAKNLNAAVAIAGVGREFWDSWEKAKREEAFRQAIAAMVENFEKQRHDLVELINGADFAEDFFPGFHRFARFRHTGAAQRQGKAGASAALSRVA